MTAFSNLRKIFINHKELSTGSQILADGYVYEIINWRITEENHFDVQVRKTSVETREVNELWLNVYSWEEKTVELSEVQKSTSLDTQKSKRSRRTRK